ncbi:metal-dependent hydrolase [Bacillaceae bacterium SIJ1]|uniref:metal-dependent hydrolase n=1 Tax=Litoribacterium kuwaitense TaxID=1398745 RepID=UPI0013EDBD4C|nr:metal-dependent hydrolase [Litoribacterium kuwaitense]NGP46571.1 metal-dependent hydrolase [Litoribacterium kuwaitense]
MDTGTHLVMGIALGGLATLDPVVALNPITAQSVLIATIVGSQIPDIDTVLKFKNNATYIRHHRGITHSPFALVLWTLLLTGSIWLIWPETNALHLLLWTALAVFLHVFVDIFNAYGTQALRPFSQKWVALGMINTFDPTIFALHLAGIGAWISGAPAASTFGTMYSVLILYYIYRYLQKRAIIKHVNQSFDGVLNVNVSPSMRLNVWHLAVTTNDEHIVAKYANHSIQVLDTFKRQPFPEDDQLVQKAMEDPNVASFLSFSPVYRWEIKKYPRHYEIRFIDLRYWSKGHYPFVAMVCFDFNHNCVGSYTGWVFSEKNYRRKYPLFLSDCMMIGLLGKLLFVHLLQRS